MPVQEPEYEFVLGLFLPETAGDIPETFGQVKGDRRLPVEPQELWFRSGRRIFWHKVCFAHFLGVPYDDVRQDASSLCPSVQLLAGAEYSRASVPSSVGRGGGGPDPMPYGVASGKYPSTCTLIVLRSMEKSVALSTSNSINSSLV